MLYVKPLLLSHGSEKHVLSEWHLFAILLQALQHRAPWKLSSRAQVNEMEWGHCPTVTFPGWLLSYSLSRPFAWLQHQDRIVILWGELLADRCVRITLTGASRHKIAASPFLCGCVCYRKVSGRCKTHFSDGLYSQSTPAACVSTMKQLRKKISFNIHSPIFSSFHFRQILPEKNKRRQLWETQICSYILILWLSNCLLVADPQFAPYQNKYSKDTAPNTVSMYLKWKGGMAHA